MPKTLPMRSKANPLRLALWALCLSLLGGGPLPCWSAVIAPTAPPKVLATCGRGMLLEVAGQRVLLLAGAPYEMGYQQGRLLPADVQKLVASVLALSWGADIVAGRGFFNGSLTQAFERTAKYIDARYLEEMRGLAEGAGVPLLHVQTANIFPELFHCSGFALFGKATVGGNCCTVASSIT